MSEMSGWYLFRMSFSVIPMVLVCFAGVIASVVFIKRYFWPSILTLAAMLLTMAMVIAMPLVQLYLMNAQVERGWTTLTYGQALTAVDVIAGLGRALAAILLLIAVFAGRKNTNVHAS